MDKRKEEVTGSIEALNAMTPELQAAVAGAKTLAEVEDIYRPYKPCLLYTSQDLCNALLEAGGHIGHAHFLTALLGVVNLVDNGSL